MWSNSRLKQAALAIFQAGVDAVDPYQAVKRSLRVEGNVLHVTSPGDESSTALSLADYGRIVVVGAGKASAPMATALEEVLGPRIDDGVVVVKYGHSLPTTSVKIVEAGHPIPDEAGLAGAQRMVELLTGLGKNDLVFALFSGGGSALLPLPAVAGNLRLSLEDKQQVTELLLSAGATIDEINCVRKHLSAIKGGQLARHAAPARVVSLMLSDVIGDRLDVIASGATVPDPTTFAQADDVLVRHRVLHRCPRRVQSFLKAALSGRQPSSGPPETPKPGDPVFFSNLNVLVGTNRTCLAACLKAALTLGFASVEVLSSTLAGEAKEVARELVSEGLARRNWMASADLPVCLLAGGETTVTIRGDGKGGRNQELALAGALALEGHSGIALFSAGTDGTDGPTDAAGAIAFGDTVAKATGAGLKARAYLDNNDSYHFFRAVNDLVITGPTRTNVMDVQLVLVT